MDKVPQIEACPLRGIGCSPLIGCPHSCWNIDDPITIEEKELHQLPLKGLDTSLIHDLSRGDMYSRLGLCRCIDRRGGGIGLIGGRRGRILSRSSGRCLLWCIVPLCGDALTAELIDLRGQELLIHPKDARRALEQHCSLDHIRDEGNATHDVGDELGSTKRVMLHLITEEVYLEVDEVRLVLIEEGL